MFLDAVADAMRGDAPRDISGVVSEVSKMIDELRSSIDTIDPNDLRWFLAVLVVASYDAGALAGVKDE